MKKKPKETSCHKFKKNNNKNVLQVTIRYEWISQKWNVTSYCLVDEANGTKKYNGK